MITGFEPFGGEAINPSWEGVRRLPDVVSGCCLHKLCLPVAFEEAASMVMKYAEQVCPDVILCIGQAGGRKGISVEMVGINHRHASMPDNRGYEPKDQVIIKEGNDAYFSTIPVRKIADAIKNADIPADVSYSAGAYVCNDVLYTLLYNYKNTKTKVGFIHIPYSEEQQKSPSMKLEKIINSLQIAISTLGESDP